MSKIAYENPLKILSWSEEDRPREKFMFKGRTALSDAELLAILIGSGTPNRSAVDLAKLIMQSCKDNINELAKVTVNDLKKHPGIGEAKAVTILAALELGRRRNDLIGTQKRKITNSKTVYEEMKPYLLDKPHEEFWIILLNRANQVMRSVQISVGGVSGTAVDIKVIFKLAVDNLASSVILVHNHPSGQLSPSAADCTLTRQIKEAGRLLDMPVLDHMIFTDNGYYSFKDEGEM
ncbi:DNA repair protein RadC [Dyadobacter chenwenxiniae]|uniref:DNA repair protein RadC n=1 Tax=Dyadobacter chenwenxiniae TaxID=2906456 RepID=A0A9X1PJP1_9BACT|nr:DNA repair protein RadC [Dyadobacter chenwenxiniae]MCF0060753.1 DNA repair protein RadC [Dyadobacter chenwenxiniae]UON80587.1 DNA repair protein RadC [Dyadobacter chenwenxiniae]